MRNHRIAFAGAALKVMACVIPCVLVAGDAVGQDMTAPPFYGTYDLATGFTGDPISVAVQAGGDTEASELGLRDPTGGACRGFIAVSQPDVRVNFVAGTTFPLGFYVESDADTTLCINLPDASWRCNDDFLGLNPAVQVPVDAVQSGQYDIWVGTFNPGSPQAATLFVTELDIGAAPPQPPASQPASPPPPPPPLPPPEPPRRLRRDLLPRP